MDEDIITPDLINIYQEKYFLDSASRSADNYLYKYFQEHINNKEKDDVLTKLALVNLFYFSSAYPKDVGGIYSNIKSIDDIDERLKRGDDEMVSLIGNVTFLNKKGEFATRSNHILAVKFCHFHYPNLYPFFDSHVDRALWHLRLHNVDLFTLSDGKLFKRHYLERYDMFIMILDTMIAKIRELYSIEYTYFDICTFLSEYGREHFSIEAEQLRMKPNHAR